MFMQSLGNVARANHNAITFAPTCPNLLVCLEMQRAGDFSLRGKAFYCDGFALWAASR